MIVISPVSGSLSDRIGTIPLMITGIVLSIISFLIMWTLGPQTKIALIILVQIISGMTTGIFLPANNSLVMGAVQPEKRGMASALSASMLHFGLTLGMAWTGMFFSLKTILYKDINIKQGIDSILSASQSVHPAFHDVIIVATSIQLLTLIWLIIYKLKADRKERI